jgi:hypothetical protein
MLLHCPYQYQHLQGRLQIPSLFLTLYQTHRTCMCPCVDTHPSTATVCLQSVDMEPRPTHSAIFTLPVYSIVFILQRFNCPTDGQLCRYGTSGQLAHCDLPLRWEPCCCCVIDCANEFLPLAGHRRGLAEMACDQSFPYPGTAALTLSHARSQRHDQICQPLLLAC